MTRVIFAAEKQFFIRFLFTKSAPMGTAAKEGMFRGFVAVRSLLACPVLIEV
jgi:hypothetical protein